MQLNLALPYRVPNDERFKQQFPNMFAISAYLITNAVVAKYQRTGMNQTEARVWGAIQNALFDARGQGYETIEVSRESLQFLYEHVDGWSVPPAFASWFLVLLAALAAAREGQEATA